ncbi:MAG: HAD-IA family hydrolase [Lachnospiraceae bacterium]|nr:HAD-IA family hydrolase [Lachnospiraceae bacterium]
MHTYIFDFNGTMVMDSYMHETAWRYYVEQLCHRKVSQAEFQKHVHGKTSPAILEHFLGEKILSPQKLAAYSEEKEALYRELCLQNKERFHLTDGLPEFLDTAKKNNISMTIATAANLANINFYFDYFGLDKWFDKDRVAYDNGCLKGKPEPDIYLQAMHLLSAKPEDCIVFEDAVSGVISAHRAGAGRIIGIYGDSDCKLLQETGFVDICIRNFCEASHFPNIIFD